MISEVQKGWLAGIIDGEGTITLSKRKRSDGKCRNHGWQVTVRIANTDIRMIDEISSITIGITTGSAESTHEKRPNRCKKVYYWMVVAKQAYKLLAEIRPYLICKKDQADLAMRYQERLLARRVGRKGLSEEELLQRQVMCEEMRKLNQRGPGRQEMTDEQRILR